MAQKFSTTLLFFIATTAISQRVSAVIPTTPCDFIIPMKDFDARRLEGDWYIETSKTNGDFNGLAFNCTVVRYERGTEDSTKIAISTIAASGKVMNQTFSAVRDSNHRGKYVVQFFNEDYIISFLDTDYYSYHVLVGCSQYHHYLAVYRRRKLEPLSSEIMGKVYNMLKTQNINLHNFISPDYVWC